MFDKHHQKLILLNLLNTVANRSRSSPSSFFTLLKSPWTALQGPHQPEYTSITACDRMLTSCNNFYMFACLRDPLLQCKAPTGLVFPVCPINRIATPINRFHIAGGVLGELRLYLACNCICFFGGIVAAPELEVEVLSNTCQCCRWQRRCGTSPDNHVTVQGLLP